MARAKAAQKSKKSLPVVKILDAKRPLVALRAFIATLGPRATPRQGDIALGAAQLLLAGDDADATKVIDLILAHWSRFPDPSGFHAQEFLRNAFTADDDVARLEHILMLATANGIAILDEESPPEIPVRIEPHVRPVRAALDKLIATLADFGQRATRHPPATIADVVATEAERQIQLPNDYRALLTITDGLAIWDHTFYGTGDYRTAALVNDCIPIANCGQPDEWLVYDSFGRMREGEPGYVLMLDASDTPLDGLVAALGHIARTAADALATN